MNWQSLLAALAVLGIAVAAGGAAVSLGANLGSTRVVATVLLVAVLVVGVVASTVAALRRTSTPYW
jgi:hypothetical protein